MLRRETATSGRQAQAEQIGLPPEVAENPGKQLTAPVFSHLYDTFFPRVYNYFSYHTHNREEAEDLTAQLFERVITRYHQFDAGRGSFESWLFGIARHSLSNQYRTKTRHPQTDLDESLEDHKHLEPAELVLRQEELERLRHYLSLLGERDRELIALRYGASLSQRRVGELLGMSESNVSVSLGRALRRLRRLFEQDEVK